MEMIIIFNALLEVATTGLFAALFIYLFARLGLLPIQLVMYVTPEELEEMEKQAVQEDEEDF